jgi:hypothetical protein
MPEFANDSETERRRASATEFYVAIGLDDDYRPDFVSDEASLYDFQMEDDDVVIRRVALHDGVTINSPEDFRRPFWQLLDDIGRKPT